MGSHSADIIPIEAYANVCIPKAKSSSKWHGMKDCSKADFPLYRAVLDTTLQKIGVPFSLLLANVQRNIEETKIQVNALCTEITHALLTAEKAAIPVRNIREGSEIPRFSKNQELVKACQDAKFWFSVWRENGHPKSSVLNGLRVHTKRKFEITLKQCRTNMKNDYTERIINDPSRLWKDRMKGYRSDTALHF